MLAHTETGKPMMNLEETLESGVDDAQRGGLKGRYAIEAWQSNGMEKNTILESYNQYFYISNYYPGYTYCQFFYKRIITRDNVFFLGLYQYRY